MNSKIKKIITLFSMVIVITGITLNSNVILNRETEPKIVNGLNQMHRSIEVEEDSTATQDSMVLTERETKAKNMTNEVMRVELKESILSIEEIVQKVIDGEYGEGQELEARITSEGYDFQIVQTEVKTYLDELEKMQEQIVQKEKDKIKNEKAEKEQIQKDLLKAKEQEKLVQTQSTQSTSGTTIKAYPHVTFKSYMRWGALATRSPQYKLCSKATADPETAILKYNGRYLVAFGYAYAEYIGQDIDIIMESGEVIPATVGDWKAIKDTDSNRSSSLDNGSIIEFIVSSNEAANKVLNGSGNYNSIFKGKVKEFTILN